MYVSSHGGRFAVLLGVCVVGVVGACGDKASDNHLDAGVDPTIWAPPTGWQSVIGIPDPPFGIETSHSMFSEPGQAYDYGEGPEPYRVGADGPYTHYVDFDHPEATDVDNPFGTHTLPRETVPPLSALPAGSVVEIHGGTFEGPGAMRGMGTAAAPIFIRGALGDEPVVTGGFRLYGDYTVVEHLRFDLEGEARNTITVGKYEPGPRSHIAIRWNEFSGGQHVPTQSYQVIRILHHHNTAEVVSDIVVWGNHFHHIGDGRGEAHYDAVAVSVDTNAERVWIVDNYFHHIGGDGIQIACDAPDLGETYSLPSHIYVGRNVSHDHYENFLDLKLCQGIVVSENEVFNDTPLNPDNTPIRYGTGEAADPSQVRRNIWTLFNVIHDVSPTDGAFLLYSSEELPYPTEHYYIGNIVYNVHNADGNAPAFGAWNVGVQVYLNNLVYNCDVGFSLAGDRFGTDPSEQLVALNNIVSTLHPDSSRTYLLSFYGVADSLDRAQVHHNLYDEPGVTTPVRWGLQDLTDGLQYSGYSVDDFQTAVPGKGLGSLEVDPLHADPQMADFRLAATSPAVDAGTAHGYYDLFFARFGIDIAVDASAAPVPVDGTGDASAVLDMGPHEHRP